MMAKITKGSSFGDCVRYVTSKKGAELIAANGVLLNSRSAITDSFEAQSELNPRLGKKVGHISLNFSAQDKDKIDNAFMLKVAREYRQGMGIVDTQYIIVRHNDREHPHCHIVFNRVSNSGKTISDQNDRLRSVKACRALTEKYGLYLKTTDAKQNVKRERLRGSDKIKYEIYDTVKAALSHCKNWGELQKQLENNGVSVTYKFNGGTGEKQGVIFGKSGHSFNGSKVDRQFSYSKLDAALNENAQKNDARISKEQGLQTPQVSPQTDKYQHSAGHPDHSAGSTLDGLFDIKLGPKDELDDEILRKPLKKKQAKPRL